MSKQSLTTQAAKVGLLFLFFSSSCLLASAEDRFLFMRSVRSDLVSVS